MSVRLYVGNLPYNTTDEDLQRLFSQAGEVVSAQVITDRDTGRSRGFGFVEMEDQQNADEAIRKFDGKPYENRQLTVNIARPRAPRSEGGRGGGGG
ncbi:MAG TPA: RNA-binding protein, partial [Chloroflexi bacterium]|nr:RNA-binding protein [Chloroflexota bacterium]